MLSDGKQTLELYSVTGNPHVEPKVLAYVPSARALFQSDLWFPGLGAPAGPEAVHLLQSINALKLPVATHVGGHGGVGPHAELVKAVAAVEAVGPVLSDRLITSLLRRPSAAARRGAPASSP